MNAHCDADIYIFHEKYILTGSLCLYLYYVVYIYIMFKERHHKEGEQGRKDANMSFTFSQLPILFKIDFVIEKHRSLNVVNYWVEHLSNH